MKWKSLTGRMAGNFLQKCENSPVTVGIKGYKATTALTPSTARLPSPPGLRPAVPARRSGTLRLGGTAWQRSPAG